MARGTVGWLGSMAVCLLAVSAAGADDKGRHAEPGDHRGKDADIKVLREGEGGDRQGKGADIKIQREGEPGDRRGKGADVKVQREGEPGDRRGRGADVKVQREPETGDDHGKGRRHDDGRTMSEPQPGDDKNHNKHGRGNDNGRNQQNKQVRAGIFLDGIVIGGVKAEGHALFRMDATRTQLKVEAEEVNLANGTVLTVSLNGSAIGSITLSRGFGELELNSRNGSTVPVVHPGDVITVSAGGTIILHGTF